MWNWPKMNVTCSHSWSVSIGLGDGLVLPGDGPLPDPTSTQCMCHMASMSHIGLSNETLFAHECDMVILLSCLMFSLIVIVILCARVKCANAVRIRASWWCHQMEGFSALLAICAGDLPVTGEFPSQGPVARSLDVFIDGHSYIMYQGQVC